MAATGQKPEFDRKLPDLTPERRRLLRKLLSSVDAERGGRRPLAASSAPVSQDPELTFETDDPSKPESVKAMFRRFYNNVSKQLDSGPFGEFSYFLNYGYVPNLSPTESAIHLPSHYLNKNSVRLVLELVGKDSIDGRRVLDIGCGRGGTVHVLSTFFKPASVTGLDLSTEAIAFCRRVHKETNVYFQEGDAEALPFPPETVDLVTNVESSHSYPNIYRFFDGVYSVLAHGGRFLYTDVHAVEKHVEYATYLKSLGFVVESDRDITANVLLSCDEIAGSRVQAFSSGNAQSVMANFLAVPGSEVYESMKRRLWTYKITRFRKS